MQQPEAKPVAPDETDLYETLVAEILEYLSGKGAQWIREQIKAQIKGDIGEGIGKLSFVVLKRLVEKMETKGAEYDLDMLLGAATETIDAIGGIAETLGMEVSDDDTKTALMKVVEMHLTTTNATPEEKAEANEMLTQMGQDGTYDEAATYIKGEGNRAGVNFDNIDQREPETVIEPEQGEAAPQQPAPGQRGLAGAAAGVI